MSNELDYKIRYQRMVECRSAIRHLLVSNTTRLPLSQQLKMSLECLREIPWLTIRFEGAIFLLNSREELVMVAEKDLNPAIQNLCATVKRGQCLCGQVAASGELLFVPCIDANHTTHFDGMAPHGHYILPLKDGQTLIGVLTIYTQHGHHPAAGERELLEDFAGALSSLIVRRQVEDKLIAGQLELSDNQAEVLNRLSLAAEHRDSDTGAHTLRVARYSSTIAKWNGLSTEQQDLIWRAAPLHDVGKIGIRDEILLKPSALTPAEFEEMKHHTTIGANILKGGGALIDAARTIALSHHEKFSGGGYPLGLVGEAIPLFGRICGIADVFDALTMRRPYKEPWDAVTARDYILANDKGQFDPALIRAFERGFDEILRIKTLFSDDTIDPHEVVSLPQIDTIAEEGSLWRDEFSVGIDVIDEHHRYLLQLIAQLDHALRHTEGIYALSKALYTLKCYVHVHFREEERMMEAYHYPLLEQHRKLHDVFRQKLQAFQNDLKENPLVIGYDIVEFLRDWFISHIQREDRKIMPLIGQRQPGGD